MTPPYSTSSSSIDDVIDQRERRAFRRRYVAIVAAGAVLRLLYLLAVKSDDVPVGDEIYYSAQAVVIANGDGFSYPFPPGGPAANHAPLTAAVLASVSWVDDSAVFAQRALMSMLGVGVVAGIGFLARQLLDRRATLIATAIAAAYAGLWLNDGVLMAETLAAVGVVALLTGVYIYRGRSTAGIAGSIGVAIAFAGLARAELLVLGGLIAALMFVSVARRDDTGGARAVGHVAIAAAVSLAVIAPWVIHNQMRFEESTYMSTQDGLTLIGTNCPAAYDGAFVGFWAIECADLVEVPDGADQSVASALYREYALDYLGDHVGELPGVVAARLGRGLSVWRVGQMADFNATEGRPTWGSWVAAAQFWLLVPLAAIGFLRWRTSQLRWPLLVTIGFVVMLMAALYGIPRFRLPAEIALVIGAACGLDGLLSRRRVGRDKRPSDAVVGILDRQLE